MMQRFLVVGFRIVELTIAIAATVQEPFPTVVRSSTSLQRQVSMSLILHLLLHSWANVMVNLNYDK